MQARKYKEALLHAHTAVKNLPESAIASCLLGFVHLQTPKGDIEVAKKWLCKALRQDPSHRESALALVSIHSQAKDWDAAIAVLERQLLQQPSDLIHQRLGEMHWCAVRSHWTPLLVSVTVACWCVFSTLLQPLCGAGRWSREHDVAHKEGGQCAAQLPAWCGSGALTGRSLAVRAAHCREDQSL